MVYAHLFMLRIKKTPSRVLLRFGLSLPLSASQNNYVVVLCFTKIKGTMSCAFLVHAHHQIASQCNCVAMPCIFADGYGQNKSPPQMQALERTFVLVGVARLELAASWSRTKRATKLRYTPTTKLIILCLLGFGKCFQ